MPGQTYYHTAIPKLLLFPEPHIWDTVSSIHATVIAQTATSMLSCHWQPCIWKIREIVYHCANSTTISLHLTSSVWRQQKKLKMTEEALRTNLPTLKHTPAFTTRSYLLHTAMHFPWSWQRKSHLEWVTAIQPAVCWTLWQHKVATNFTAPSCSISALPACVRPWKGYFSLSVWQLRENSKDAPSQTFLMTISHRCLRNENWIMVI